MEKRVSLEAKSSPANQEIPRILWNPKDHYCLQNSPPIWATQIQYMPSHLIKIYYNTISPATHNASKWPPFLRFLHQSLHAPLSRMCHIPLPFLGFDHPNWWGVKSWSFSLCNFFHSTFTSFLLGPYIFLVAQFSNTFNLCSSRNVRKYFSHPYRTTGKHLIVYFNNYILS
jgi:hypothetical protein